MDGTAKRRLAARAERELTNYFNEKKENTMEKNTVNAALVDRMNITIVNSNTGDETADILLAAGTIPTEGVNFTAAAGSEPAKVEFHRHNLEMVHKTLSSKIDAVVDDFSAAENGIKITASSQSLSLRQQIQYLHENPRFIKQMIFECNDADFFAGAELHIGSNDPFGTSRLRSISLSEYLTVDQESKTKIVIPFAYGDKEGIQWNSDLLMVLRGIPAADGGVDTKLKVLISFFGE